MRGFWKRRSVLALVLLAISACGLESAQKGPTVTVAPAVVTPTPTPCAPAGGAFARVRMESFRFEPACLSMHRTQGLALSNASGVVHNFSIPGTLVDLDTTPGADRRSEAIGGVVRAGVYDFYCKYHRSRGMTGTVRVLQGR